MKILFVTECLGSGGAERQLVGLATMLKERGYDVSVLTYYKRDFYKGILEKAGVPHECDLKSLNKYWRFYRLSKKADSYNADIVVSYLPGSNVALTLGKLMGLLKAKLIVSERNFTLNWSYRNKFFYWIISHADCLVTNSNAERINVKENISCYNNKEIITIQNFIDSDFFTKGEGKTYENTYNIVCVARLRNYKNVLGFIDCVYELKNKGYLFTVNWYGHNYNDEYSIEVTKRISELQLKNVFILHEPSDNIRDVYRNADALCLPSFREGYPNVVVEAMSCELPIICSNVCENPNIVEDSINGFLFNPYDIDSMVKAMEKFFILPIEKRVTMGMSNREKVVRNNSMVSFVNQYIDLFDKLLN